MLTLPPILDQYDDQMGLFLRELGGREVPQLVKTAANMSAGFKHAADFALVAETPQGYVYKFPVLDGGNTLMSAVYFEKTASALPPRTRAEVAGVLAVALQDFGFEVPDYINEAMECEKTAAAHEEVLPSNTTYGEQELVDEFSSIHPMQRPAAARMLKEAGVALPAAISCYAREELGTDVLLAIRARERFVDQDVAVHMRDLVKVASVTPVDEMAAELYKIDVEFGLTRYYDTRIPDPYRSLLGTEMEKRAEASITVGDRTLRADEIRSLAEKHATQIDEAFGDTVSMQLIVTPIDVLGSLPTPHQQAIVRIFNGGREE